MVGPVPANGECGPRGLEPVSSLVASVSKDMIVLSSLFTKTLVLTVYNHFFILHVVYFKAKHCLLVRKPL